MRRGPLWELARFAAALALPRRLGPLRLFLAAPLIVRVSDAIRDRVLGW